MARKPGSNHGAGFNAIALAAIRAEKTLTELAEQFDMHPHQRNEQVRERTSGLEAIAVFRLIHQRTLPQFAPRWNLTGTPRRPPLGHRTEL